MFSKMNTAGLDVCGVEVPLPQYNGTGLTAYTASARAKGAPVYFVNGYTVGQELVATTPLTGTLLKVGWALEPVAAGAIGIFVTAGFQVPILVYAQTALAVGRCLHVITAGTYATDQGSSTIDATAVALVQEALSAAEVIVNAAAGTTSVLKKCVILTPYCGITAIVGQEIVSS